MLGGGKNIPAGIGRGRVRRTRAEQQAVQKNLLIFTAVLCVVMVLIWMCIGINDLYVSVTHSDICQPLSSLSPIPMTSDNQLVVQRSMTHPLVWIPYWQPRSTKSDDINRPALPLNSTATDLLVLISNSYACIEKRDTSKPCSLIDVHSRSSNSDGSDGDHDNINDDNGLLAYLAVAHGWHATIFEPRGSRYVSALMHGSLLNPARHINGKRATELISTIDVDIITCEADMVTSAAAIPPTNNGPSGVVSIPPVDYMSRIRIDERVPNNAATLMRFCSGVNMQRLEQMIQGAEGTLKNGRVPNVIICIYPLVTNHHIDDDNRWSDDGLDTRELTDALRVFNTMRTYGYTVRNAVNMVAHHHQLIQNEINAAREGRPARPSAMAPNINIDTERLEPFLREWYTSADTITQPLMLYLHRYFSGQPLM